MANQHPPIVPQVAGPPRPPTTPAFDRLLTDIDAHWAATPEQRLTDLIDDLRDDVADVATATATLLTLGCGAILTAAHAARLAPLVVWRRATGRAPSALLA